MKQGHIFIIAGPAGVGKNTIIRYILNHHPNFTQVPTYTTRPLRAEDKETGVRIFATEDAFHKLQENDELVGDNKVHAWLYGKKKKDIEKALTQGKNLILEIDVNGLADYKDTFPNVHAIFVSYENLIMLQTRLRANRSDCTEAELELRYQSALNEMKQTPNYDYVITNIEGKPEIAINKVEDIIKETLAKGTCDQVQLPTER